MNTNYTLVRDEGQAANLVGENTWLVARSLPLQAHLVQRQKDGRIFLLLGATACETQGRAWAEGELRQINLREIAKSLGVDYDLVAALPGQVTYVDVEELTVEDMVAHLTKAWGVTPRTVTEFMAVGDERLDEGLVAHGTVETVDENGGLALTWSADEYHVRRLQAHLAELLWEDTL